MSLIWNSYNFAQPNSFLEFISYLRAGGIVQMQGPEFKAQYNLRRRKKEKKEEEEERKKRKKLYHILELLFKN